MAALFASALIGICLLAVSAITAYRLGGRVLYALVPLFCGAAAFRLFLPSTGMEYMTITLSSMVIGILAGYTFAAGKPLAFYLMVSALSLAAAFSANYYFLKEYRGVDLVQVSEKHFGDMVKAMDLPETEKAELLLRTQEGIEVVRDVIPFSYFFQSLLTAALCYVILRPFFARNRAVQEEDRTGLAFFRLKDHYIFAFIAAWLMVLLIDETGHRAFYVIGLNVALCFSVLYLVQALGVVSFFLRKKGVPGFILPLAIFILFLFGLGAVLFVSIVFLSVGAIDFWADFRKLGVKGEQ